MSETVKTDGGENLIAEAIVEAFGTRCPDYDKDCWCCKAWQQYDDLRNSFRETLGIATRNEDGPWAERARAALSLANKDT